MTHWCGVDIDCCVLLYECESNSQLIHSCQTIESLFWNPLPNSLKHHKDFLKNWLERKLVCQYNECVLYTFHNYQGDFS